jgi:hypothetical protein
MPFVKKHSIAEYWKNDSLIGTPMFAKYMSRDRYLLILRYLHFANNVVGGEASTLWKLGNVITHIKTRFSQIFKPFQKLVIDESLMSFKGRLSFKQYIPSKRHRFGIKLFILCDCKTGIILDFIVYTGKTTNIDKIEKLGISGSVVSTLLKNRLNLGHILYTDNWYTSPALCSYLHENKTALCGTVKPNRKGMPKLPDILNKGDCILRQKNNILVLRWKDKRNVTMLATNHTGNMLDTTKLDRNTNVYIKKPDMILDYNINMRLIDKSDMQIGFTECMRKSRKWYRKLFFHLIDITMLNSFNLYKDSTSSKVSFTSFVYNVILELLNEHGSISLRDNRKYCNDFPGRLDCPIYMSKHFLKTLPGTGIRKTAIKNCYLCLRKKKRKATTTHCYECKVYLCVYPCFTEFHTLTSI